MENTSRTKTVSSYELYLYPEDASGNRMFVLSGVYKLSGSTDLRPGQRSYTPFAVMLNGNKIAKVYAAVHQVEYTDGTVEIVAEPEYVCWVVK